jgi:hypothetical protein
MAEKNNEYVNGIYIDEKEGMYGTYLSIGITKEGLENLKNVPANEKGWINLTAGRQKANASKFSVKPYVAKNQAATVSSDDDSSTLPF